MKKFYLFILLFVFLLYSSIASATNRQEISVYKRSYYAKMKSELSDDEICESIEVHLENQNNIGAFHLCIGGYVCGYSMVRELMEEKLSGIGNVLRIAKDVDAGKYGW